MAMRNISKRIGIVRGTQAEMSRIFADGVSARLPWTEISDQLFAVIRRIEEQVTGCEYSACVAFVHAYREFALRGLVEWRKSFRGQLVMSSEIPDGAWGEVDGDRCAYTYKGEPNHVFM